MDGKTQQNAHLIYFEELSYGWKLGQILISH